ncbi:MAG: nucleotide exchange factor GrpE [Prevotella sp.]|nr:nucleotide exchange factor GrpE [Prevotella sp.]MEE0336611.1 nucleotide exchange factor GrpE [Prevotella sp.]
MKKDKDIKEEKDIAQDTQAENASNMNEGEQKAAEAQEDKNEEKTIEQQLQEANEKIAELKDQYLRKAAEFENYRKRTLKEKSELILNGAESTVKAILPILDDFERALADKTDDCKAVKEGQQLIFNKFVKALKALGVEKIETQDQDFDVDYHEAIAMVPGMGDDKKGKVIDCVQTGYKLNDKVIRHAKVAVGQ